VVATNLAAAMALATPPAPNVAASTMAKVAGGINIAAIAATAIKGFAKGGLAQGGMAGRDSIPSMLQNNELVSPAQNFEEVIGSVRAERAAQELREESGGAMEVIISLKDDLGDFIETTVLERRVLGYGAI